MKLRMFTALTVALLAFPFESRAQEEFGKNKVAYEETQVQIYRSPHFDISHYLDLKDERQRIRLEGIVNDLESAYTFLSGELKRDLPERASVVVFKTHRQFTNAYIIDGPQVFCRGEDIYRLLAKDGTFLPEGVMAFVDSTRSRMVLKLDASAQMNRSVITHELGHVFQFAILKRGMFARSADERKPGWIIEGGAEFFANLYRPYTRDDLRGIDRRGMAANPEKDLPTLEQMESESVDPYTVGPMSLGFIREKFGEDVFLKFYDESLKTKKSRIEILADLTHRVVDSPEKFDQMNRDYWRQYYAADMLARPRPYQETDNFKGRSISPPGNPYPIFSPAISPDGKRAAFFTIKSRRIALVSCKIPEAVQEEPQTNDEKKPEKKKLDLKEKEKEKEKEEDCADLAPWKPPKHYEYPVVQMLDTAPFNGSDLDWSRDGKKIAYFAEKGRDHALTLLHLNEKMDGTKKVEVVELPLDQAFSPAFSPEGDNVYFSASKDAVRDIYVIDLKTRVIRNLTRELTHFVFSTAPAISPDGTKLAYVAFDGDFQKLFLMDLATLEKRQLTFNRFNDNSPNFYDNNVIYYTSDEKENAEQKDPIWNLYSIDTLTNVVRQRTSFFGGVFTPKSQRDKPGVVDYVAYWQYDQYESDIHPNFKLYEVEVRKPYREYVASDKKESTQFAFRTEDLFAESLDQNQLKILQKPKEGWVLYGRSASFGYAQYWGAYGGSTMYISNLLEDKHYLFNFAYNTSFYRVLGMEYENKRHRWNVGYSIQNYVRPLYYDHYDATKGIPKDQLVLNNTLADDIVGSASASYPFDKFHRVEFSVGMRHRSYNLFGIDEDFVLANPDVFRPVDLQFVRFFRESEGTSLVASSAWVRDTIVYSNATQGPLYGDALKVQSGSAPGVAGLLGYNSLLVDARKYFNLGPSVVFAMRGSQLWTSRSNGDFILLRSPDIRGYDTSIAGNNVSYVSAELRFPLVTAVFPGGIGIPLQGLLFADAASASFSHQMKLLDNHEKSYGLGFSIPAIAYFPPSNFVWARREIDNYSTWHYDFYFRYNW